jgi:hypothetical protein
MVAQYGGIIMADAVEHKAKRDRSPAFPAIPLGEAVDKLIAFEKYFRQHPAAIDKVGLAWGVKQAADYLAALRYYGFVEYVGNGTSRQAVITESGRNFLRAQQEAFKQKLLREAALKPKEIAKFWTSWGADRLPDPVCIDELIQRNGFSERGARLFLNTYDGTIAYAKLAQAGKIANDSAVVDNGNPDIPAQEVEPPEQEVAAKAPPPLQRGAVIMEGERELTTGLLSKDSRFRLIVSGRVGVKEIERLIRKLELDKEILAEGNEGPDDVSVIRDA